VPPFGQEIESGPIELELEVAKRRVNFHRLVSRLLQTLVRDLLPDRVCALLVGKVNDLADLLETCGF
jgi:hypothetical protein